MSCEYLKWVPRGLTSLHDLISIAYPMRAIDCEDARSERWMAIGSIATRVQFVGCGVAVSFVLSGPAYLAAPRTSGQAGKKDVSLEETVA